VGQDLEFLINGEREERRQCMAGTIDFFRFEPPTGTGTGGKRLYGQDVPFEKSVVVLIGSSRVKVPHIDSLLGRSKISHKLESGLVIMTYVEKNGKTIVSCLYFTVVFMKCYFLTILDLF
jgi:hypothetical protein